jgi:hypothetical protein
MRTEEPWRDFEPGGATIRSMVYEDAWYPLGVKAGRLVDPSVPGAKAAHQIAVEETAGGDILSIATDGERWIFLDTVPSALGAEQLDTIIARSDPPARLTVGDRDHINRLIVYHLTKLLQYHLKSLQQLPTAMPVHMTRYIHADDAFYDCD